MRSALLFSGVAAALLAMSGLVPSVHSDTKKAPQTMGSIERDDPQFDRLVPKDASIEKLADGMDWAEGPVWIKEDNCLLFSDIPNNRVLRWDETDGSVSVFLSPDGIVFDLSHTGWPGAVKETAGNDD